MADWKDKLRQAAAQQGIVVQIPQEMGSPSSQKGYGRPLVRQIRGLQRDRNPKFNRWASAPYNFVPLNEKVVTVNRFDGFHFYDCADRNTGYLECEIETLAPVYIRGTMSASDHKSGKTGKQIADFFSPGSMIRIPGSSLRGMIRNLVEMLSWSKMTTDRRRVFHYRALADMSNLRDHYRERMNPAEEKSKTSIYQMSAGYLEKLGTDYQITPAQKRESERYHKVASKQFYQLHKDEVRKLPHDSKLEEYFSRSGAECVVISGRMPNKKHEWVINPPDEKAEKVPLSETDVRDYLLDENRTAWNLIELLRQRPHLQRIPCFYVEHADRHNERRVSFGHTAMFRLAHEQRVGDLLPEDMRKTEDLDLSEAIFGRVDLAEPLAGRVFFEDAEPLPEQENVATEKCIPDILASPKPTTFQHYLVQTGASVNALQHYDAATFLRGHKLYWHHGTFLPARELKFDRDKFKEFLRERKVQIPPGLTREERGKTIVKNFAAIADEKFREAVFAFVLADPKSQYTVMRPVRPGVKFRARIRFENLSNVELGALLFALQLPEHCCHKIGMGKPLGLGSIKITPRLFLSDRQQRYSSLAHEWTDNIPPTGDDVIIGLKNDFESFIVQQLEDSERPASQRLWDTYRLQQLQIMLDWRHTQKQNWREHIRYLEIEHPQNRNEYKNRPVLPLPEEVVERGA